MDGFEIVNFTNKKEIVADFMSFYSYIYQLNFHHDLSYTQTRRVKVNGVIVLDTANFIACFSVNL